MQHPLTGEHDMRRHPFYFHKSVTGQISGIATAVSADDAVAERDATTPARLVTMDCYAAARVWEAYSNYAPTFAAAALQPPHSVQQQDTIRWPALGLGASGAWPAHRAAQKGR